MLGSREVPLNDYLNVLRQHHFKIVLAFLLTFGTALVISFYLPRTYEVSTFLEVQASQRSAPISTNLFQSVFSSGLNRGDMENLARRFTTQSLLTAVMDDLEMQGNPGASYFPSVGRLRANIAARIVPETSYLSLSVRLSEDQGGERNAALLANTLVQTLQNWRALEEKQKATSRQDILEQRLSELQQELTAQQQELFQFMEGHGSPATWYPLLTNLLERRKDLGVTARRMRTSLEALRNEQEIAQMRLSQQPEFAKSSETLSTDPFWSNLKSLLSAVNAEIAEAAYRYGEQSPEWLGLQEKRKELERQAQAYTQRTVSSTTSGLSPLYVSLLEQQWTVEVQTIRARQELEAALREETSLEQELRDLLNTLPSEHYSFDLIRRKIDALYNVLLELRKQSVEAEILLAESDPGSIQGHPYPAKGGIVVVDRATPIKIAVSPDQRFIVMLAALVGLGLGILWAFASAFLESSSRVRDEVAEE